MLGGVESRGVLRKISDMLEVIMKRMDALSKLGNATDTHRLDELSSALDRYSLSFFFLFFPHVFFFLLTCVHLSNAFYNRHS